MNRYKKLFNNSILFALGNLGSKLINILLVPLYTHLLTTAQYGNVDITLTTINLLYPVISFSIFDAVLRFIMDKSEDNKKTLSNAFVITCVGCMIMLVALLPIMKILNIDNAVYLCFILVFQVFQAMFSEYSRAVGKVKIFAFNGILGTFMTGISNIILMVWLKQGVSGYFLSIIISAGICILFLCIKLRLWKIIKFKFIDVNQMKEMLYYSIPLIPNALAWWATSASNRYFILYFVGMSANGFFAIANKIPNLLSMLNSIFFQSWQMSAIEEYESKDKSQYFSNILSFYIQFLFIGCAGILLVLRIFMKFFVANSYYDAWKIVPFLLLSVVYSSISAFLGTNYIAAKQTTGIMITTFLGAILNIILCFILVPILKTNGAAIASAISFLVICFYRLKDTEKFVKINLDITKITINHILFAIQVIILFVFESNLILTETVELLLFILVIFYNKNLLRQTLMKLMK